MPPRHRGDGLGIVATTTSVAHRCQSVRCSKGFLIDSDRGGQRKWHLIFVLYTKCDTKIWSKSALIEFLDVLCVRIENTMLICDGHFSASQLAARAVAGVAQGPLGPTIAVHQHLFVVCIRLLHAKFHHHHLYNLCEEPTAACAALFFSVSNFHAAVATESLATSF